MNSSSLDVDYIIDIVKDKERLFKPFLRGVAEFFEVHPRLNAQSPPVVHSVKSRLKDYEHLKDKIMRQRNKGVQITDQNVFKKLTDIAGVRVLHLHQDQLLQIHEAINEHVREGEWVFDEPPKAYSWDPDSSEFFENLGLSVEIKESHYTSVHYLVRPRTDALVCCEIQVRTLFEEVWGEIDHAVNYPHTTDLVATREQLRVLAKIVAAGSRLADGIFRVIRHENIE